MRRNYEIMFIVDPTLSDEEVGSIQGWFTEMAQRYGAEVQKIAPWERRRLAYQIKGRRDGIYILANLSCEPAAIREVERQLEVSDTVLRHIVVRLDDRE